jgi:predicted DNA-binding transcriptional regulator YafY
VTTPRKPSKLQRWTDLIAALLARKLGATFDQLARDVPGYADGLVAERKESVKRTFERDKDELREFGIPIETIAAEDSEETKYRLKSTQFYLPFLTLQDEPEARDTAAPSGAPAGYRDLPTIPFTPDDLELLGEVVARVEQLGDPLLAEEARSALGKLAFDLPVFGRLNTDVYLLDADTGADPRLFEQLSEALRKRKLVTFNYAKPASDGSMERHVEPYGLFFLNAHWYLAGRDHARDAVRNFRVSRMRDVDVNARRPNSADYDVPEAFRLKEHAKARDAWELGDGDANVARVKVRPGTASAAAISRIGEAVEGEADTFRFAVRRLDPFARWLLSFAGDARPLSPRELVDHFEDLIIETLALYGRREGRMRGQVVDSEFTS